MSTTTAVNWTFWANMLESKRQEMTITCLKLRPTTNTTTTITYSHPTLTGTWSSGNLRRSRVPSERCKILSCRLRELEMLQQQEAIALWKWHGSCTDCFSFKNTWNAPSMKLSSIHPFFSYNQPPSTCYFAWVIEFERTKLQRTKYTLQEIIEIQP